MYLQCNQKSQLDDHRKRRNIVKKYVLICRDHQISIEMCPFLYNRYLTKIGDLEHHLAESEREREIWLNTTEILV